MLSLLKPFRGGGSTLRGVRAPLSEDLLSGAEPPSTQGVRVYYVVGYLGYD